MLHTDVIYVVHHATGDGCDYGWSPDGEGMYWRDSMKEVYYDAGFSSVKCMTFDNVRDFDNHRYGHMPEDWQYSFGLDDDSQYLSGSGERADDPTYISYLNM